MQVAIAAVGLIAAAIGIACSLAWIIKDPRQLDKATARATICLLSSFVIVLSLGLERL